MIKAVYVPWLHMHQPFVLLHNKLVSNLEMMLESKDSRISWDAKLMIRAYNNPAKYCNELLKAGYKPKIMLDFSGTLLETLEKFSKEKDFSVEVYGEKIKNIIKNYKDVLNQDCIEIAGTAFSHCYFPITPEEDWGYQLEEWRNTFERIFGRKNLEKVKGFWLPEMGVPGFEDRLVKLIKTIKEYYEWCILPLQAIEGYEQLSYQQKIQIACQPHLLKVSDQFLPVIFRVHSDFIDQQAGCDADCVHDKIKEAIKIFEKISNKPALIVPATDGENGNVMMNEFFPKTFLPFFKMKLSDEISSMTVTEFLHTFYEKNGCITPEREIKLKLIGSSWVGNHRFWLEGTKRQEMINKIYEVSKKFHQIEKKTSLKDKIKNLRRLLLIAETSCYVYWGEEFWFEQGNSIIRILKEEINNLSKNINISE